MLDALIFPDEGTITAFGKEIRETLFNDEEFSRFFRSKVGFVFQNPDVQLFCPTVKEDIVFGPLQLGVPAERIRNRFEELVAAFGLEELLRRSPHQLSVGEKRKVTIASVLAAEPQVLLLDEPTAGLDPATSRQIVDIVACAHMEGRTVVTATHDLHILEEISDIIYCFGKDKKISRYGTPTEVLQDRNFLEENNLVHIHSHRHKDKVHVHPHEHLDHHIH
jgi:cobalt/nickel transport system ATP-binding protein